MTSPPREEALRRRLRDLREGMRRSTGRQASELIELADVLDGILSAMHSERESSREHVATQARAQARVEGRLERLEQSIIFRLLRRAGFLLGEQRRKAGQRLLHSRFHPWYQKLIKVRPPAPDPYRSWLEAQESNAQPAADLREQAAWWPSRPLISVLMPVHNPRPEWLQAAVDSVLGQSYNNWELIFAADGPPEPWLRAYLQGLAAANPRIRWTATAQHGGISRTLNAARDVAKGDYIGFLDQDDLLSRDALFTIAKSVQDEPSDVLYSDEEWFDGPDGQCRPNLKPDWSPDLLASCMYWGHFFVVSRPALDRAGWFRPEFDGAQDYDLALRLTDIPARVAHITQVLYHWRQHPQSTAQSAGAKPYAHDAGRRALEDAIARRGWDAQVADGEEGHTYRLQRAPSGHPLASLIICTRNPKLLRRCLRQIETQTEYPRYEVIVVHHQPHGQVNPEIAELIRAHQCREYPYTGAFHFSRMNNAAAQQARGSILVFLNDDVAPLQSDWLDRLAAQLVRSEVGIAGAKLLYPSGVIQHAGMVVQGQEGAFHPGRGMVRSDLWRWLDLTRNVSAVTGACLAIRRKLFDDLGGFDPLFPVNFNDVDLCLRARQAGFEIVYEPQALLRHDECQTRLPGVTHEERRRFLERWSSVLPASDPFYSPVLDHRNEQTGLLHSVSA